MWRKLCTYASVVAVLCLTAASIARGQTVYVSRFINDFGTVDLSTGIYTLIGNTPVSIDALTFTPDGTLYGLGTNGNLYTVNPATAQTTDLGSTGTFFRLNSLAARGDGLLFADDPFGDLYRVDPATALATLVGGSGVFGLHEEGGLAFGPDDTLYSLISFFGSSLYTRDPQTGAAARVGTSPTGINSPGGLFFDNDRLYAFDFFSNIYTIDTTTGVGTPTGVSVSGGFGSIRGAAAPRAAIIPEPSTLALLVSISVGGAGYLLRKRRHAAGMQVTLRRR